MSDKVKDYVIDGFKKVCDVFISCPAGNLWDYKNVDQTIMFDDHNSWVYFIVVNGRIYKIGETGQPLGIRNKRYPDSVKTGSTNRFGRYRNGDTTDYMIRKNLYKSAKRGRVSIWAKKCDFLYATSTIGGNPRQVSHARHKEEEQEYLNHFISTVGRLPTGNPIRI